MLPFRGFTLLVLIGLTGCTPNFTGSYEGPMQTSLSCPGADSKTTTLTAGFTISDVEDLLVADAAGCVGVPATVKGTQATLLPYPCPTQYRLASGAASVTGGSFELQGSDLKVVINGNTDQGADVCSFSTTGTLHRIVTSSSP